MSRLYLSTPSELYDLYHDFLDCDLLDYRDADACHVAPLLVEDEMELRSVWAE